MPRPHVRWDVSQNERSDLRDLLDDATNFMGGALAEESAWPDDLPRATPETGSIYILVPSDGSRLPWRDNRVHIGFCSTRDRDDQASPAEERRCPFGSASFVADTRPDLLHRGLYLDALVARPDLPRRLLWEWVKQWKVIRIHLTQVRVVDMTGKDAERFVPGGEPALRRSEDNWGYVRFALAEQRAALVKLESDPAGDRVAHRLLFFYHAADALESYGAIQMAPVPLAAKWLPALDERAADGRRLVPRMLKRPVGRLSPPERCYESLVRVAATSREYKKKRRTGRQHMLKTVWAFLEHELRLDPKNPDNQDPAVRAEARILFIMTVKSMFPGKMVRASLLATVALVIGGMTDVPARLAGLFF